MDGGEEDASVFLTEPISQGPGEMGLAQSRCSHKEGRESLFGAIGLEEFQVSVFDFLRGGNVIEVKGLDGLDLHEPGLLDPAGDRTLLPGGDLGLREHLQCLQDGLPLGGDG